MMEALQTTAKDWGITAIVAGGRDGILAEWGAAHLPVNVRSVRKGLLSGLYGAASFEKPFDLTTTLAALKIDDRQPFLTDQETQATIRDLLMARSGVYHSAAYEAPSMKAKRPARGSHAPGSFWYYNNWDFNVLGVIYERLTGEDVYQSFAHRIANRIGMEDFSWSNCCRVYDPVSDHPAHTFRLSAYDLVRFGLLFLNRGRWDGRAIIPDSWVAESTSAYSQTDKDGLGYGYLWWVAPPDGPFGSGAYFALGHGGQGLAVLPDHNVVVAQVVNVAEGEERLASEHFAKILRLVIQIVLRS